MPNGKDASAGTPKSASKSSIRSKSSKTSLLSISGSRIETYAEVATLTTLNSVVGIDLIFSP